MAGAERARGESSTGAPLVQVAFDSDIDEATFKSICNGAGRLEAGGKLGPPFRAGSRSVPAGWSSCAP